jgi:two-component system OmpR family response regulator
VVEDDEDSAESTRRLLLRYGAQVEVSSTGADALARARRLHPELALVDLRLPDGDGFELIVRLRAGLSAAVPACVAISGRDDACHDARAGRAAFDRYLQKPVEPALLRELVEWARSRRRGAAPPSPSLTVPPPS